MSEMNRLANADNRFQNFDQFKRTLCLCSAGLLRSPTMAFVLSQQPFNRNARAAGVAKEFALIPVDKVLLFWADEIVCSEPEVFNSLVFRMESEFNMDPSRFEIHTLDIPDQFDFRDPELVSIIEDQAKSVLTI